MFWTVFFAVIAAYIVIKLMPAIIRIFAIVVNFFIELPGKAFDSATDLIADHKVWVSRIILVLVIIAGLYFYDNSNMAHKAREESCNIHARYDSYLKKCFCYKPYVDIDQSGQCIIDQVLSKKIDDAIYKAQQQGYSNKEISDYLLIDYIEPAYVKNLLPY